MKPAMMQDVPITVDFRQAGHAQAWAESAMSVRPWRAEFFAAFVRLIASAAASRASRVLELGSGPGFLAEQLLASNADLAYVALDFWPAMHELARQRLGARAEWVERSLRDADWGEGLGRFDFVVTH